MNSFNDILYLLMILEIGFWDPSGLIQSSPFSNPISRHSRKRMPRIVQAISLAAYMEFALTAPPPTQPTTTTHHVVCCCFDFSALVYVFEGFDGFEL